MSLRMKEKVFLEVDYYDFEEFVKKIYELKEYSFVNIEECANDSFHSFLVNGKIEEYYKEDAEKIRVGEKVWSNGLLLNVLCADGHIKPGNYLIQVSW